MDYIRRKDDALASSLVGVPRPEIEAIQAEYGITLPSVYVDFLLTMGEDSGPFQPFGDTQAHSFADLVAQLPAEDYPSDRFFKVAFETDSLALARLHTYIDLARSDGHDAALVTFEEPWENGDETDVSLSLAEKLIVRIVATLDHAPREFTATVTVSGGAGWDGDAIKQSATRLLEKSGFAFVLPDLPRVACQTRGPAAVVTTVSYRNRIVAFRVAGETYEAAEEVVRQILAGVPGATLDAETSPRTALEI